MKFFKNENSKVNIDELIEARNKLLKVIIIIILLYK